ncbi:hypothetical protein D3C81_2262430 [compost metagenome]
MIDVGDRKIMVALTRITGVLGIIRIEFPQLGELAVPPVVSYKNRPGIVSACHNKTRPLTIQISNCC